MSHRAWWRRRTTGAVDIDLDGAWVDEAGLDDLYRRYRQQVMVFVARFVDDHAVVEDLTQQTFVEAFTKPGAPPAKPLPWLYSVARNLACEYWRPRRQRDRPWLPVPEDANCDDGGVGYSELRNAVAQACLTLTDKERHCLLMSVHDHFSDEDIAHVLGISRNNVRQQRHRARDKLRRALDEAPVRRPAVRSMPRRR